MVDFEPDGSEDASIAGRPESTELQETDDDYTAADTERGPKNFGMTRAPLALLYLNVLIIATCGLVYELLAGTLASYVLGDSVTQFSLIIGVYLSALGVGAWLSGFIKKNLARVFIEVELGVALLGGTSTPLLFLSFARLTWFHPVLYGVVFGIGVLVGLELPLLMRILKDHLNFEDLVSRVLAFDYIGALVASLLFPLFLVPALGLVRTSLLFGMLNAGVGLWGTALLRPILTGSVSGLRVRAAIVLALLTIGMIKADRLTTLAEDNLFAHQIVYTKTTPYQRIVVTQNQRGFQLHLNGNLQFDSFDEYRYHEALVHPPMAVARSRSRVLILGGGDGLALREVLRYDDVEQVTLVDIDPGMTALASEFPPLEKLNASALRDSRATVVNDDAMIWLGQNDMTFDAVIIDFPDPNSFALGKLYSVRFYTMLQRHMADDAVLSIQSTSPLLAPRSYWCVATTLQAAGFHTSPYHASVPSFGEWGFVLAGRTPVTTPQGLAHQVRGPLRFLNDETLRTLFHLPADIHPESVEPNRLNNQSLVRYYEHEAARAADR